MHVGFVSAHTRMCLGYVHSPSFYVFASETSNCANGQTLWPADFLGLRILQTEKEVEPHKMALVRWSHIEQADDGLGPFLLSGTGEIS